MYGTIPGKAVVVCALLTVHYLGSRLHPKLSVLACSTKIYACGTLPFVYDFLVGYTLKLAS